ncbi:hypothetical protein EJ08DRAFT_103105 [Tothia fuscella]|uniref:RRM domain-containing protein n=1 Tax=Tothia fuscella TaxID=1048955 RepID=A0A9P4U1J4_9PEZI|nr:hypothetical protein EJ08DRAFT_103105 [Tothia fuscella]
MIANATPNDAQYLFGKEACLFVNGLDCRAYDEEIMGLLELHFKRYGTCWITLCRPTTGGNAFAFVQYVYERQAAKAEVDLNGMLMFWKKISVCKKSG